MSSTTTPIHDFGPLAAQLEGALATPTDPDWDQHRQAWNLSADQRPEAVVHIAGSADAAAVIDFARRRGLRVTTQATGHQAAALGDLAGTVLVRTDALREISVDAQTGIVRVGAGVTWGEVGAALAPTGRVALAGSSHDVGVAGYSLGGGSSWLARRHGLAASAVTAVELVTGDGRALRVDADHEPDLFWAVRGGGGAFGVVTALEFQTLPIESVVAGALFYPIERAREVLRAYAAWTAGLPDEVTTSVRLLRFPPMPELPDFIRGRELVVIDGAIIGTDEEAAALLGPLRDLGPETDLFARMPATLLHEIHMDPPAPTPARGSGLAIRSLSDDVIDVLLAAGGPGVDTPLLFVEVRHFGGALGRPDPRGGAVDSLDGAYLAFALGVAPGPDAVASVIAAYRDLLDALRPWAAHATYSNFVEEPVPAAALFPADVLARLQAVKAQVDPENVIRAAHELS